MQKRRQPRGISGGGIAADSFPPPEIAPPHQVRGHNFDLPALGEVIAGAR